MSGSSSEGPEYVALGPQSPRPRRRGVMAAIIAGVVVALVLPLGAFAVLRFLGGGGTQPHDVLPGNAVGYFRIDLDPSAPEKIDALRFLRTFPAFEKYTRIDSDRADVREVIVDAVLQSADCDLDFDDDVAPWLGDRFGVAATPSAGDDGEPRVVAAVQVTDEDGADEGLAALRACDSGDTRTGGWAYLDGYMLVAETEQEAAELAAAAEETPLSDNEQFAADMDTLGEPGVASLWFDGQGVLEAFRSYNAHEQGKHPGRGHGPAAALGLGPGLGQGAEQLAQQIDQSYRSGAVAFRFAPSHLELATVLTGSAYVEPEGGEVVDMALPSTTALAFGFANGSEYIEKQWDTLLDMARGGPGMQGPFGSPQGMIRMLERRLGLEMPADLQTLVGDNFTMAFDAGGLDGRSMMGGDLSRLKLGARVATDAAEFRRVVRALEGAARRAGVPLRLAMQDTDEGVVAASNPKYAAALADTGPLSDTVAFSQAVPDADEAHGVLFVNFDAFEDTVLGMLPPVPGGGPAEVVENVTKIRALGVSGTIHDGYSDGAMRITVGQ